MNMLGTLIKGQIQVLATGIYAFFPGQDKLVHEGKNK